jgi:inner membrane protein
VAVFLLAVWGHLLLDSVASDIWWLWPWLDSPFSLVVIPAIHTPWWLNFLLHWTFAVELGFVLLAVCWERSRPLLP